MKVISSKVGSPRERVDAEADLLDVANWRPIWAPNTGGHGLIAAGRALVLSSRWGGERTTELHLSEAEAVAVAKVVIEDLFARAALSSHDCQDRK